MTNLFNVLFLKLHHNWTAQCLEYDIAAQGKTIKEAMDSFNQAFASEIVVANELGKQLSEIAPPAPEYYHRLFDKDAEPISMQSSNLAFPDSFNAQDVLPRIQELRVA